MLTLNVSQLLIRLRAADKTLLAVAVLTLIALLFAGNRGLDWWGSYSDAGSLRLEAEQLQTAIANARVGGSAGTTTLAQFEAQLVEETSALSHTTDGAIVGELGDIARESRVTLVSASIVSGQARTEGPVVYRVVNVAARAEGQLSRLFGYIDAIATANPTVSVVSARLGGFDQAPWVMLDLEFMVDPRAASGGSTD